MLGSLETYKRKWPYQLLFAATCAPKKTDFGVVETPPKSGLRPKILELRHSLIDGRRAEGGRRQSFDCHVCQKLLTGASKEPGIRVL